MFDTPIGRSITERPALDLDGPDRHFEPRAPALFEHAAVGIAPVHEQFRVRRISAQEERRGDGLERHLAASTIAPDAHPDTTRLEALTTRLDKMLSERDAQSGFVGQAEIR